MCMCLIYLLDDIMVMYVHIHNICKSIKGVMYIIQVSKPNCTYCTSQRVNPMPWIIYTLDPLLAVWVHNYNITYVLSESQLQLLPYTSKHSRGKTFVVRAKIKI